MTAQPRFHIGFVFVLFLASCTTGPPATEPRPELLVALDPHGLAEFDYGPEDFESMLAEELTEVQLAVRANTLTLLTSKVIPGAEGIGSIPVERRQSGAVLGWHCGNTQMGSEVELMLEKTEALARDRASAEAHLAQIQGILDSVSSLNPADWRGAASEYMMSRLKTYETSGKRVPNGRVGSGMAWRSWMRETLAEINARTRQNGFSPAQRTDALANWLYCHMSRSEMEQLRDKIEDEQRKEN